MDRDPLERYLDDGLSLSEIGALVNRDPSTVGYWVAKHGLTANGRAKYAPRGGLTREQLEPLVAAGATLAQIAGELGRSIATVRYWIGRHGLQRPNEVRRLVRINARECGERTVTARCPKHGMTEYVIENSGHVRCLPCRRERVVEWRRRKKATLVEEAGGRCQLCGYDRCQGALEFHHVDPGTKSFGLSQRGLTRSMERCREEAAKCVLVCANCHAELEGGFVKL